MNHIFMYGRPLLWVASGLCFGISFLSIAMWPLALLGFVLLLYAVVGTKIYTHVFFGSLMTGMLSALGALASIWYIYPLDWIGFSENIAQIVTIGAYWFSASASVAIGTVVSIMLFRHTLTFFGNIALIFFPFLWVVGEILGSFCYSIFSLGPGADINGYFSFAYVGYTYAHIALLYPVVLLGGVYTLSAVGAGYGLLLFLIVSDRGHLRAFAWKLFGLLLLALVLVYSLVSHPQVSARDVRVIGVDTYFDNALVYSSSGSKTKITEVVSATLEAVKYVPDVILFPEGSGLTRGFSSATATLAFLQAYTGTSTALIVDSSRVTDRSGEAVLRAFYYDLARGEVYIIDKQSLVAQGEYVTYALAIAMDILGYEKPLGEFQDNKNYRPGAYTGYEAFPNEMPGILFCYESTSPFGVEKIARERSSSLVFHVSSHGWFHKPVIFWERLDAMLRVQAIWNNKTIVQAGNMVTGKTYLPNGNIIRGTILMQSDYWRLTEYEL